MRDVFREPGAHTHKDTTRITTDHEEMVEIVRDGWHNVWQVIGALMDEAPTVSEKRGLEKLPVLPAYTKSPVPLK